MQITRHTEGGHSPDSRRRRLLAACACGAPLFWLGPAGRASAQECGQILGVGQRSAFTKVISADQVEQAAARQYMQLKQETEKKRALAPPNHPQLARLRAIGARIVPFAVECNPRAKQWQWEFNLVGSNQINAFCMPGGKIAFYTGILENLRLNDDEVAMVMGHEIAHALQEHAREQMGKNMATRGLFEVGAAILGLGGGARLLGDIGNQLLSLKFGRDDETEADRVGLVLGARAGYDPRAGVTLWEKMGAASKGAPPQFLSTHPSSPGRISDIRAALPKLMPIYERAPKPAQKFQPAAPRAVKPSAPEAVRGN